MKCFAYAATLAALAAIACAGCGEQTPSSVSAGTGSSAAAVDIPANTSDTAPGAKLIEKKDTFGEENSQRVKLSGPLEPAASPSPAETESAAPPVNDANPRPSESAGTRPKADREPTKPGDPEKITFDDLILRMQADMVYRPFMLTERAKELEGKRVRLTGEMWPNLQVNEKAAEFIILRNKECKYGPGGQADHVALVHLKEGQTTKFTNQTIRVEGLLRIAPLNSEQDGTTKHIYVLEDAVMK